MSDIAFSLVVRLLFCDVISSLSCCTTWTVSTAFYIATNLRYTHLRLSHTVIPCTGGSTLRQLPPKPRPFFPKCHMKHCLTNSKHQHIGAKMSVLWPSEYVGARGQLAPYLGLAPKCDMKQFDELKTSAYRWKKERSVAFKTQCISSRGSALDPLPQTS